MNKYLSDKLKAISFILMGMVVFLHSYNLEVKFKSGTELIKNGYNSFIQDFFSQGLTRIAVPLFFIISGYLFFRTIKNGSFPEFFSKYRKRSKTLVLPYLLWSIYGILLYLILQSVPFSKPFFTNKLIVEYSASQLLSTIFINPITYQLWFVRDLIVLFVLSPILYWIIKCFNLYIVFIFFIFWICNFNYFIFSNESLFFFALGGLFSIKNVNPQKLKLTKQYLNFMIIWFALIIIKTVLIYINFENEWLILILHKSSILIGIISIWFLYDIVFKRIDISKTKFYLLFQFTFFLYAFHEPVLTIFTKAFYRIFGQSELSSFLIYFCAPIITISVSILIGYLAKKMLPKYYYLMTGGR